MDETDTAGVGSGQSDQKDLATFGYKQELHRTLGFFSSFAAAFSYISPSTGIFTLFALGLTTIGGVFIWSWPIVAAGQMLVALNFAEVSSHFPIAGSVFQWTKYLAGRPYAWFTGWIYIFAGVLTVTAVVVTLPLTILPMLNLMGWNLNAGAHSRPDLGRRDHAGRHHGAEHLQREGRLGREQHRRVLRDRRSRRLRRRDAHRAPSPVDLDRHQQRRTPRRFRIVLPGDVHEPLRDLRNGYRVHVGRGDEGPAPRRAQGRALVGRRRVHHRRHLPHRDPDGDSEPASTPSRTAGTPAQIIESNFSKPYAIIYLAVVSAAILVCCLSIMTATIRLCFGMSRDNRLPVSAALSRVHPKLHTPIVSCIVVAILAAIPLFKYAGAGIVAIAATGMIYLAYFLGNLAVLRARLKGWPREKTPFSLGKWGIPGQHPGPVLGRLDVGQLRVAACRQQPDAESDGRRAQHRHRRTEQGADPLHRARGHLDHRRPLLLPRRGS